MEKNKEEIVNDDQLQVAIDKALSHYFDKRPFIDHGVHTGLANSIKTYMRKHYTVGGNE